MPYESALQDSLRRLYSESSEFRISIEIIVKLAKSLSLDAFVDTEEFPGVTRLSIAGSLLLLEIDFEDDHTVSKVSLSLGNHPLETLAEENSSAKISGNIVSETATSVSSKNGAKTVVLSFLPDLRASFLRTPQTLLGLGPSSGSVAEEILFASLEGPKLGSFPRNLKYLADLDRVSPPEGDLIVYIENLATYMSAIHHKECILNPEDWQIADGLTNSVGKVILNDKDQRHVGVFLQFWQDCRVLNHSLIQDQRPQVGRKYSALLAIEESKSPAVDYVLDAKSKPWHILTSSGEKLPYFFGGETEFAHLHNHQSVTANSNWKLVLRFAEPIFFPETLLQYLGITDYECAKPLELNNMWNEIAETGELRFKNTALEYVFAFDEFSPHVNLLAVSLGNLHILAELLPALRNQITFMKIFESVALDKNSEYVERSDASIDEENKQRIRDSLQLSSDVPDAELLGLNTISNDYTGVQMLDRDLDLGDFIKSESEENDSMIQDDFNADTTESFRLDKAFFQITFLEVCYGEPGSEFVLKILGQAPGSGEQTVDAEVRIRNGQILSVQNDEDVDMLIDTELTQRFVKSLALGEDVLLALQEIAL